MKKQTIIVLGIASVVVLSALSSQIVVHTSQADTSITTSQEKKVATSLENISNSTLREFALYCQETQTSPEDVLKLDYIPKDGQRFIAIGERLPNKLPVLGVSPVGNEGVVGTVGDESFDTSDTQHSLNYQELKEQLLALNL